MSVGVPPEAVAYGVAVGASGLLLAAGASRRSVARTIDRLEAGGPTPGRTERTRLKADPPSRRSWGRRGRVAALAFAGAASAAAGHRLAGPVGGVGGLIGLAALWRSVATRRRHAGAERLEAQMREAVGVLAAATRAGLSPRRALAECARDADPPMRDLLQRALNRLDVGDPLDGALAPLGETGADGRLLVTLLSVHARTGGDLPRLLDDLAHTIGRRADARRQARALTAQGRASGAVLASLPVLFIGLLSIASGGGLSAFYRTPAGSMLLLAGFCLEAIGFVWLRRLSRAGAEQ